jgi:uncharacterized protein YjbI with pentapeptide repeats
VTIVDVTTAALTRLRMSGANLSDVDLTGVILTDAKGLPWGVRPDVWQPIR